MRQFEEILVEMFSKQDDKLMRKYENRFLLFESAIQALLENQGKCGCLQHNTRMLQVVANLEEEFSQLQHDFQSSQALQKEILKELNFLGSSKKNQNSDQPLKLLSECDDASLGRKATISFSNIEKTVCGSSSRMDSISRNAPDETVNTSRSRDDASSSSATLRLRENSLSEAINASQQTGFQAQHIDNLDEVDPLLLLRGAAAKENDILNVKEEICAEHVSNKQITTEESNQQILTYNDLFHKESYHECDECAMLFTDEKAFKRHKTMKHPDENTIKIYKCSLCSYSSNFQSQLKEHVRVHTKEKPFSCKFCSKGFARKGCLKLHMRTHTMERPYKCIHCGKQFISSSHLKRHTRHVHEKSIVYFCKVCSTSFRHKKTHDKHMLIHGDRC